MRITKVMYVVALASVVGRIGLTKWLASRFFFLGDCQRSSASAEHELFTCL